MIETFMHSELWYFIVSIAPSAVGVISFVASLLISIKKIKDFIHKAEKSDELKKTNEKIQELLDDNKELKNQNKKLIVELTRIKPIGWSDDNE